LNTQALPRVDAGVSLSHRLARLGPFAGKLAMRALMLLLVALIVFVVLRVVPSNPIAMLLPPTATEADLRALTASLGLDQPIWVQFGIWLQHVFHGDFGNSVRNDQPVLPAIAHALPVTLQLVFISLALGIAYGVVSALVAFRLAGSRWDRAIEAINSVSMAIPEFLWAILLILGFGIGLKWLPFLGPLDSDFSVPSVTGFLLIDTLLAGNVAAFFNAVLHLVMPAIALMLAIGPPLMRVLQSSLVDAYAEDYVMAARLRGVGETRLLLRHALKNAALPSISLIGVQAGMIVGGTLLIETIFGFPGIGYLMVNAIAAHDLAMIQALALTYAVAVQAFGAITDALLVALNPRLRG
jgi:peptide/nickel transport system permease protein